MAYALNVHAQPRWYIYHTIEYIVVGGKVGSVSLGTQIYLPQWICA